MFILGSCVGVIGGVDVFIGVNLSYSRHLCTQVQELLARRVVEAAKRKAANSLVTGEGAWQGDD